MKGRITMKKRVICLGTAIAFAALAFVGAARAEQISGTITTTRTIVEDSELIGDVTCLVIDAPCISVGASDITLKLNGFTMTGRAEPPNNCIPAPPAPFSPEDGIASLQMNNVTILGPGIVQKFRRHGVILAGNQSTTGSGLTVRRVTSNQNCYSGIFLNGVINSDIVENVSVRNSSASGVRPCGGNCITSSHNNYILRNVFSGNGSVADGNNDFGAGLVGNSSGNLLQENAIGGNTNGIFIQATALNNVIRRNIIAGNPAMQVSVTHGTAVGFDIWNFSAAGANAFDDNLCLTYSGASTSIDPTPCPNVPKFAGHRNSPPGFTRMPTK